LTYKNGIIEEIIIFVIVKVEVVVGKAIHVYQ